jgi:outer membrane lipoprotein-sorting protein
LLTSLGEEAIGESRTLGIEMTPKKEKIRETVGKVRLWIDQASWMPSRQEITDTHAGNTLVVTYTHMARNLKLNPDLFKAKWPRGTKKVNR